MSKPARCAATCAGSWGPHSALSCALLRSRSCRRAISPRSHAERGNEGQAGFPNGGLTLLFPRTTMNEETVFHKALVFFRRHRGASVAGALLLLALLAGIGGTTWGLVDRESN